MKEKKKVLIYRYVFGGLLLFTILLPLLINAFQPKLKLVKEECCIKNYYESLNETVVDMTLYFNREVNTGTANVEFFDESGNLLDTREIKFYAYNSKDANCYYTTIGGKAEYYNIVEQNFKPAFICGWLFNFVPFALLMFISALLINYKEYRYNDMIISVYAGYYHHTLRINRVKYDEHNTLSSFTPIVLKTTRDDGTVVSATISLTNRIAVKINDKLIDSVKPIR